MSSQKVAADKQRVSLYLDPSFYKKVKELTEKEGMTINGFFTIAAQNEIEKRESK